MLQITAAITGNKYDFQIPNHFTSKDNIYDLVSRYDYHNALRLIGFGLYDFRLIRENGELIDYRDNKFNDNETIKVVRLFHRNENEQLLRNIENNGVNSINFSDVPEDLRNDREFYLKFIADPNYRVQVYEDFNSNVMIYSPLQYSSELQDDDEVVEKSVKIIPDSIRYASERLRYNRNYILKILENPSSFCYIEEHFKDDEELFFKAVRGYINQQEHPCRRYHGDPLLGAQFLGRLVHSTNCLADASQRIRDKYSGYSGRFKLYKDMCYWQFIHSEQKENTGEVPETIEKAINQESLLLEEGNGSHVQRFTDHRNRACEIL